MERHVQETLTSLSGQSRKNVSIFVKLFEKRRIKITNFGINATKRKANSFLQDLLPVATFCKKTQLKENSQFEMRKMLLSDVDGLKKAFERQKQYKHNKTTVLNHLAELKRRLKTLNKIY